MEKVQKIIQKIAEDQGVTPEFARKEMEAAIETGLRNPDPII